MYNPNKYDRPSVSVDLVILTFDQVNKKIKVLMARRPSYPFQGLWALPGGIVKTDQTFEQTIQTIFQDKLHQDISALGVHLEQLYSYDAIDRDPRLRMISVSYFGIVAYDPKTNFFKKVEDDPNIVWVSLDRVGDNQLKMSIDDIELSPSDIAFDHANIVACSFFRVANKIGYTDLAFKFLPARTTLGQIQNVYEMFLGRVLDKSNFRKFIKRFVVETDEKEEGVAHRPSRLYMLNPDWNGVFWR